MVNGANNLKNNYKIVDALNVFPVPDGDTGINMLMTIEGGVKAIVQLHDDLGDLSLKFSRGMLMNARGNSGVILSQIFRGLSKYFTGMNDVDSFKLAEAFKYSTEVAYKVVKVPVEGTILTVIRKASEHMSIIANSRMTINEFFNEYLVIAKKTLAETPELLPVLKSAGVVDSGGAGYVAIIEGIVAYFNDIKITPVANPVEIDENNLPKIISEEEEKEFGYCTEFILKLKPEINTIEFDLDDMTNKISAIGSSIAVVHDVDIIKVHVHTLTPGDILNIAQSYGEFIHLKIENMTLQHSMITESKTNLKQSHSHAHKDECDCEDEYIDRPAIRKSIAIVEVASGVGIANTLKDLGADIVISGGKSMNPSTEKFINAFDHLNADHIIVFPNNKNVFLAANQAAKIYTECDVRVVNSNTIAEGYSALTMIDILEPIDIVISSIENTIKNVTTGLITYAIRDTVFDDITIKANDFIGLSSNKIMVAHRRRMNTVKDLLDKLITSESGLITIFYGVDVSTNELSELKKYIQKTYEKLEFELIKGGQEVYSYIIAIE